MTYTHTYVVLPVSKRTYDEIAGKLKEAGYGDSFHERSDGVVIDMHGIALGIDEEATVAADDAAMNLGKIKLLTKALKERILLAAETLEAASAVYASGGMVAPPEMKDEPEGTLVVKMTATIRARLVEMLRKAAGHVDTNAAASVGLLARSAQTLLDRINAEGEEGSLDDPMADVQTALEWLPDELRKEGA